MIIQKIEFSTIILLNVNFLITITYTDFKFCFLILHTFSEGTVSLGLIFLCYAKNRDTLCKYSKHNFLSHIKFDLGPKEENRRDSSLRYYVKSNHRKFEQAMINSNRSCANSRKCK